MGLVLCLVGCTDTVDSVTREYRNANNEAIDAMMLVTSERRADDMIKRVFKTSTERYQAIDKRLETVERNTAKKKDFVKNVFESNGVHLYLNELEINAQRFSLEVIRMRNLAKQLVEKEKPGAELNDVSMQEVCPKIHELIRPGSPYLSTLRTQLESPKLVQMMEQFEAWGGSDYKDKLWPIFEKKRAVFKVPDVQLVW
jgi:hypothetical protein